MGKPKTVKKSKLDKFNIHLEYNVTWPEAKARKIR